MDNLTHTLIGVIAGEAIARGVRPSPHGLAESTRRNLFVTLGAIGSNLPDIDLLWTLQAVTGDPLAYLVHHRGHTHTLLGCAGLALLLYAAALHGLRLRGWAATPRDLLWTGAVTALGPLLHLGMDFLNSYGVHPFWPFDDRWYYGDAVFIVEPLYWLAAAPLLFLLRTRLARFAVALVLIAAVALAVLLQPSEPLHYGFAIGLALLLLAVGWRASARLAVLSAATAVVLLTGGFLAASRVARAQVAAVATQVFPEAVTQDIVLTPSPANPLCWDLWLLQTDRQRYIARRGRLSLSSAAAIERCPTMQLGSAGTAVLTATAASSRATADGLRWQGEFSMPIEQFESLVASDCRARTAMGFFRAPFAVQREGHWILGDLRFDREPGVGFAEIQVQAGTNSAACARGPWQPPRLELLPTGYQ